MKHNEKESRLKQLLTKKNIAILSTAITVCIAVAIAIPLCVLSEQTPQVSNEMPETSSYVITETLSEESVESIESVADSSSQEERTFRVRSRTVVTKYCRTEFFYRGKHCKNTALYTSIY